MTNLTQKKEMVSFATEGIISFLIISFVRESSIWLFIMHMNVNSIKVNQSENIQGGASNQDTKFASAICAEDKKAIAEFQNVYCDEVYFVASKFNNRGIHQDSWEYRTKTGYSIRVDDDVADTYLWLIKQAIQKSCSYGGRAGASFRTYITSILNSSFTFKDWLRWKTGDTGYIPKCIQALSEAHAEIFLHLRRNLSIDQIAERVSITEEKLIDIVEEIRSTLTKDGLIDLITRHSVISIDTDKDDETHGSEVRQLQDNSSNDPAAAPEIQDTIELLKVLIANLSVDERRIMLLYWRENYSVDEIFQLTKNTRGILLFEGLPFNASSEIYPFITKLIKKMVMNARDSFTNMVEEYEIDTAKLKTLLKVYLAEFELENIE